MQIYLYAPFASFVIPAYYAGIKILGSCADY